MERFWSKVVRSDGCWLWAAATDKDGYGRFSVGRQMVLAHRLAFELANGVVPGGLVVRHTCDNPPCCRPDHLIVGTQLDNVRDMHERGRQVMPPVAYGKCNGNSELSDAQVAEVRIWLALGESHRSIARMFGVGKTTVGDISRGRTHVTRIYTPRT